jgi:hypothetical protein
MKTKRFMPSRIHNKNDKKTTDYWGMLFISFLFLSAISSFLFANHTDRSDINNVSTSAHEISTTILDTDQKRKS